MSITHKQKLKVVKSVKNQTLAEQLNCRLCGALVDGSLSEPPEIFNQIFRQWQYQLMLPAKGQLVEGHALIVTKRHWPSYFSSTEETIDEYERIASAARRFKPHLLEIEHGAGTNGQGGGCITHAHVHWFPDHGSHFNRLSALLEATYKSAPLKKPDLNLKTPYLLVRNGMDSLLIQETFNEGQTVRRLMGSILGTADWDWRILPPTKSQEPLQVWEQLI